jgi:hypothetical protein
LNVHGCQSLRQGDKAAVQALGRNLGFDDRLARSAIHSRASGGSASASQRTR